MFKELLNFLLRAYNKEQNLQDLERLAKNEYKSDWEYAFHMLSTGQQPVLK